jgi:nitroimidazol reductase NimA-like FMN-containing flavoprotein (pyridoxamine 5'-phosphate oxidase superfamily)
MTARLPDLTRVHRHAERGSQERTRLDALLDDELVGTLSTVVDGQPWAVPLLFARDGDRLLLHGSTGAGALRHVVAGASVAFSVTAIDAIVVAHSTFDSSANYRSAVLRGTVHNLRGPEQAAALDALSDRVLPGRTLEVRGSTPKEWAATLAMELPINEGSWTYKERTGGPSAPDEEVDVWCGVIPLRRVAAVPEPAAWSVGPVPASVLAVTRGRE